MTKTIIVERVPLEYRPADTPSHFPPMPVLYLEFIENKDKVKPELRDKASAPIFLPENTITSINPNVEFYRDNERTPDMYRNPERDVRSKLNERMRKKSKDDKHHSREVIQDYQSKKERELEEQRDRERSKQYSNQVHHEEGKPSMNTSKQPPREHEEEPRSNEGRTQEGRREKSESREKSPQTKEILDMLGGTKRTDEYDRAREPKLELPIPYSINTETRPDEKPNLPPTLDELNADTVNVKGRQFKDVSYTSEEETAKKRELLFRFDILRKSYKEAVIPEYSEFTDLRTLERTYEDTVRKVALDSKVDGYKKFLTMGFFGIEFLFSNVLKLDMTGFAKQQMMSMNSYERILIELGEKSLLEKTKSQWPAEVRLLFTIVINGVMFVLMKSVMNGGLSNMMGGGGGGGGLGGIMGMVSGLMGGGGGGGLAGMMSGLAGAAGGNQPETHAEPESSKPKPAAGRKMKGPSINIDDVGKKQQ